MRKVENLLNLVIFIISMFIIHYGNRETSLKNLLVMLIGMFGVLYVLYRYNKRY
ncbi:DUF6903 family protein [Oceanivirga salmonicida]|uniref:DUF6903 family protein n=1 Tax=Oceanivirga salmonicida TaxID=1769291 RepID=UPI0012E2532B|nr:hypothetical protein [Oceanivirga salmonicida]